MGEQEIYIEAMDRQDPADRRQFLDEVCGDDSALRERVEKLILHADQLGSFLEKPPPTLPVTADLSLVTEKLGTLIDRYKLLQQIGEGGMGVVYMAEQTEPVQRRVALKIIKPGMDTRQVIARFEAERQALAIMDHPNIAKVLDAGATESGRPYFVMELVKGIPITQYCDQQHLTPKERLELFIPICQAIQHAHQKSIIHRDIKPNNILVALFDGQPVPKVIDFGVAKATSQKLTEKTMFTQYGQVVGTLEYMSPEQANLNQLDIDTRSDIYSLGVLLYELLTGATPFDRERLRSSAFEEMLRIIREEEPPKLSARLSTIETLPSVAANRKTTSQKLTALVRGELDWIVMKALEKDRARRYETANSFANDIQRYLHDEPVVACPPSAAYRFRKFARRNKRALTAAAIVLVFALTAAGGIGWLVRDRAAREARVAAQVERALEELDRLSGQKQWPAALAAARRAAAIVAAGEADAQTKKNVQLVMADLRLVQRLEDARLRESQIVEGGFDFNGAERAYAQAFADVGVTREGSPAADAGQRLRRRQRILGELAVSLTNWARLRRRSMEGTDDTSWRNLLELADEIDPDPWRRRLRGIWKMKNERTTKLTELANAADLSRLSPSNVVFLAKMLSKQVGPEEAVKLLLPAQQRYPGDFWINFQLAINLLDSTPKRPAEAFTFFHVALALRPGNQVVLANLGSALGYQGKLDQAVACNQKAIELDPRSAWPHYNLGVTLRIQGKLDEAIACYRKAIELEPKSAWAHSNLGAALGKQGKLVAAIACCRKSIELDPKSAFAHTNLGAALEYQGKLNEAVACYHKAVELDPKLAEAHHNLGSTLEKQGKPDEAITCYQRAVELEPKSAWAHNSLGIAFGKQGKLVEAIACWRRAIELDPKSADAYSNVGTALEYQGKLDEAITYYRKAIELDPKLAAAHHNLGAVLEKQKKLSEVKSFSRNKSKSPPNR